MTAQAISLARAVRDYLRAGDYADVGRVAWLVGVLDAVADDRASVHIAIQMIREAASQAGPDGRLRRELRAVTEP